MVNQTSYEINWKAGTLHHAIYLDEFVVAQAVYNALCLLYEAVEFVKITNTREVISHD